MVGEWLRYIGYTSDGGTQPQSKFPSFGGVAGAA